MIYSYKENEREAILDAARFMVTAARTAPKACGEDSIEAIIIDGEDKDNLSAALKAIGEELGEAGAFFVRDSGCVDGSEAVVVIGVKRGYMGLGERCSLCGFAGCGECAKNGGSCFLKVSDLGIAVGSAVSVAADHRIDNRVMYTVGKAAMRCGFMSGDVIGCYGIPLSASGKSIFFDRGPGDQITKDLTKDGKPE